MKSYINIPIKNEYRPSKKNCLCNIDVTFISKILVEIVAYVQYKYIGV